MIDLYQILSKKKIIQDDQIHIIENDECVKLKGDASTRNYFRTKYSDKNYILCFDTNSVNRKKFINAHQILKDNAFPIPNLFFSSEKSSILILEDLGNKALQKVHLEKDQQIKLKYYKSCIDWNIKLLSIKNHPKMSELKNGVIFDRNFLIQELINSFQFIKKYFQLTQLQNDKIEKFANHFIEFNGRDYSKDYLVHRDFHSKNIYIQDGKVSFIDFQDLNYGHPCYDIASLLDDCYVQIEQSMKEELLNYFYIKTNENLKMWISVDEFRSSYNKIAIQRILKAIGTFIKMYYLKNDTKYLRYIENGMSKILYIMKSLSALEQDFLITFFEYYYEN